MSYLQEEQIKQFEKEYSELRESLLNFKEGENVKLRDRKLELANTMEIARRVFLHFAETGKVDLTGI